MRLRQVFAVLAVGLLCSCAGGTTPGARPASGEPTGLGAPGAASTPTALSLPDDCVPAGRARLISATASGSAGPSRVTVGVLGAGPDTVVLSDESDEDLCSWLPLADHLNAAGYRVAVWDYGTAASTDELAAVLAAVRADGAGPVVLMGASKGAKASLVTAAGAQPSVAGVVSLSAEFQLAGGIDVSSYIGRIPCPLLLLTAADDKYGSAPAARAFAAAARPGRARLLTLPGDAHGTALLQGPTAAAAQSAVDAFLGGVFGRPGS